MKCPRCGADLAPGATRCVACRPSKTPVVAAGVLTPPPVGSDDAPTSLSFDGDTGQLFPGTVLSHPDDLVTQGPGVGTGFSALGLLEPGQAFGNRYHIIRALGIGGMGAVYQAWDAELGIAVAIKIIRPDVMADPTAAAEVERRFKRELLLARQVTHKNVVRIHDLGEINGIKYITMSYVDGEDLATMLKRDGTLPVPTVMRIARALVSGLVEAHQAGVVHRDLKPANIMIDRAGDALIMDFGIARSSGGPVSAAAAAATRDLLPARFQQTARLADATVFGAIVGTVEYMAPEQARGEEVDQRSDIYALGLILYDMLVGRRRSERAESAIAELRQRMEHSPPPPRTVVASVPEALDRLIARCLEPDRDKRYATTADLAVDLDRLDDNAVPIPEPRRFTPRLMAAAASLVAVLVTGTWWLTRTPPPPKQHDPVSVLIADFQNQTGDATFDRTLEPMLRRALEGAGFINAYDRSSVPSVFGVAAPAKLDDVTARELAVKQGVGVILNGLVERQGSGYAVSVKATESITGKEITVAKGRTSGKDQVLGAATKLVASVRRALGDETSESAQLFAMTSVSATSLDVVRYYAASREAAANGKFEESRQNALKAVELDPKLGIGYQLAAVASNNLKNTQDAEQYIKQALRYVDSMTERERYATRGFSFRLTGDYQQCMKEYGELIARYSADVAAHNQLALCSTHLRDLRTAVNEMRRAVEILPNRVTYRGNLAVYANYASDFQTGEKEARKVSQPAVYPMLALAFAQIGQRQLTEAAGSYEKLSKVNALGASFATSGLADLAIYEGRFSDALRILEQGAAADLAAKSPDRAARKFAALAHVHSLRRQKAAGVSAVEKALANSKAVEIRFLAARTFVELEELPKARALIDGLAAERQVEPRAYAKIAEGEAALKDGNAHDAVNLLTDANKLLDTWIGRFELGRAYLAAGEFPQADSEFESCLKRRGEALSLFLDEWATYGYLPSVYYYQGRVREELKTERFADSYRQYLDVRGKSTEDPLLAEVHRRAGR